MQWLKILLVLIFFVLVALLSFYLIPVNRTFYANISLDMSDVTVFKVLTDTGDWKNWYAVEELKGAPVNTSLRVENSVPYKQFNYRVGDNSGYSRQGEIKIKPAYAGESAIQWNEKVVIKKNILEKLRLIFAPSGYSNSFLGNVSKFKGKVDHPGDVIAGIRMEVAYIPSFDAAVKIDTIPVEKFEKSIGPMYQYILGKWKDKDLKYPGLIQTRFNMINDSIMQIQVAAVLKDSMAHVVHPLTKLEVPYHTALIAHTKGDFADIGETVKIMKDWLKKHSARPSAELWLEHQFFFNDPEKIKSSSFNIVQPIYFLK